MRFSELKCYFQQDVVWTAVWISQYGDLKISVAQFEESFWSICGEKAPLKEEPCLYTVSSYLEHFLHSRECCLCDFKHVSYVHRRFLSLFVTQLVLSNHILCHLATISAPVGCSCINKTTVWLTLSVFLDNSLSMSFPIILLYVTRNNFRNVAREDAALIPGSLRLFVPRFWSSFQ